MQKGFLDGRRQGVAEYAPGTDCYVFAAATPDLDKDPIKFLRAPRPPYHLPGIPPGTKLNVRARFITDDRCPVGAGKIAYLLDRHNVVAVFTGTDKGIAWIMAKPPPPPPRRPTEQELEARYERELEAASAEMAQLEAPKARRREYQRRYRMQQQRR